MLFRSMIAQVPHRLPELRFRRGAEDLRGGALVLGVGGPEQHTPAPDGVVRAPDGEAYSDELSIEPNRGEVVNDGFAGFRNAKSRRLCGHADP